MQAMFVTGGIVARTAVRNSGGERQIDKGVQPTAGLVALTNTSGTVSPELYAISPRVIDVCTKSRVAQGPYRTLRRRNEESRDNIFSSARFGVMRSVQFIHVPYIYKKNYELKFQITHTSSIRGHTILQSRITEGSYPLRAFPRD